ncbi:MAG: nucleoside deaminase [Bacteroidetes bacterium]|nr:nucleoside deaminase [Bacteroidota bacterium]
MMEEKKFFMREAFRVAIEGVGKGIGGPFGAVVVRNGEIISRGCNSVLSTNDPTAHAEVVAIREACKNLGSFQLNDCEIYTSCEPCPMCMGAIYWARPLRVYFAANRFDAAAAGFDDSFIYDELLLPGEERKIPLLPFLREESAALFKVWNDSPLKKQY